MFNNDKRQTKELQTSQVANAILKIGGLSF